MLCLHVFGQTGPRRRVDCLARPHKDEGMPLSDLLNDTTSKLAGKLTVPVVMITSWLFLQMYRQVSHWNRVIFGNT